jgi:S1-C subfamily serine protease
VVKKNTNAFPFAAPKALVDAYQAKKFGPYVDETLGEVPVDFLSDLHITGGNSGSAVLNAKGEITGLAFDSTYETLGSDWLWKPKVGRCIGVDIRYVEWLLDAVDGGDNVLTEMGRTPAVP